MIDYELEVLREASDPRINGAIVALDEPYRDPDWGLKASDEDRVGSLLAWMHGDPRWSSSDGIEAMRRHPGLRAVVDEVYERSCEGIRTRDLAMLLLETPELEAVRLEAV